MRRAPLLAIAVSIVVAFQTASAQSEPPAIVFTSHSNGQVVTAAAISISWDGCSHFTQGSYLTRLNGVNIATTQSSQQPCFDYSIARRYTASGTLSPGSNKIYARVCDQNGCTADSIFVTLASPAITVTPDGAGASVVLGNTSSSTFTIQNTGSAPATASFAFNCGSGLGSCSQSLNSASLAPGAGTTVSVTYTGTAVTSTQVSLSATYNEYPSITDNGYYNVSVTPVPVASVQVTLNGSSTIGVGQSVGATARTFAASGAELTGRTVTWSGSLVSPSPTSGVSPATTTATGNSAGGATLTATSEGVSSGAGITVVNPTYGVVVTPHASSIALQPGTSSANIRFDVTNTSSYTTAATFNLSASRTGIATLCSLNTPSVTLAPGETAPSITATCSIAGSGSGSVTLTASSNSPAVISHAATTNLSLTATYGVTVVPSVASRTESAQTTSNSMTFTVTNTSQNTGPITFSLNKGCTGVAGCGDPLGTVTLGEGASTTVTYAYTVSLDGTSGTISVQAAASSPTSFSATGTSSISTTAHYAVAVTRAASSSTLPGGVTSAQTDFTIQNLSTNFPGSDISFDLTAVCAGITSCATGQGSVALARNGTVVRTVPFAVSLINTTGSVQLTAAAGAPSAFSGTNSTSIVATTVYSVAVAPPATQTLQPGATSGSATYSIRNTSTNAPGPITFALAATCAGVASCSSAQGSTTALAYDGVFNHTVPYNVSHVGTSGSAALSASSASPLINPVTGTTSITPVAVHSVTVIPATTQTTLAPAVTSGSSSYQIRNTSTNSAGPISFTLAPTCTGILTCTTGTVVESIAQGVVIDRSIAYNVSLLNSSGSASMSASAASPAVSTVTGSTSVNATVVHSVVVTPTPSSQTLGQQATSGTQTFTVRNSSTNTNGSPIDFTLTASCSGVASCTEGQGSIALAQGAESNRTVSFSVGAVGTIGTAALTALATVPVTFNGSGSSALTATPYYAVVVEPPSSSQTVYTGTQNSHPVTIRNVSRNSANAITASLPTPGCTGGKIGNCNVAANSATIAQGETTSPITFNFDGVASGSQSVSLNPSASVSGGSVVATGGTLSVTVSSVGNISVATSTVNRRTTSERSDCLTIAAGQNAAYECGDLRVIHQLPVTTTMGTPRGPTLLYNSRFANPGAVLAADVTYIGPVPQTLQATVTIPGRPTITRNFSWNPACFGQTCRIAIPVLVDSTWLFQTTLQVKAMSGTTTHATSANVVDTVVTVNRKTSIFGAGWWIDGLEMFNSVSATRKLWVGGDGSTRLYVRTGDTTVFVASPAYDRPDTLKRILGNPNTWQRRLPNGAWVEFNNAGRHTRTVNTLGWVTRFVWAGTLLDSIVLPVGSGGPIRAYKLGYTSGTTKVLASVTAPTTPSARVVTLQHTAANIRLTTGITDVSSPAVLFLHDGSNRIIQRRNKLNDTTFFEFDNAGSLKQVKLSTRRTEGADSSIITQFRAAETRSIASATDLPTLLSRAYSLLEGPRNDVGDSTRFFIDRFGSPDSVINALNERTRLLRTHSLPALVTKTINNGGFETRAYYNSRGLLDSTEAVDPFDAGCNGTTDRSCLAVTRYRWHPIWNVVDSTIGPTGDRTRITYHATRPVPISSRVGSDVGRTVNFRYYESAGWQVRSVIDAVGNADSVTYDNQGNVKRSWTPMGRAASSPYFTEHFRDLIGRDTLVVTPIAQDTTTRQRFVYDARDRLMKTVHVGPSRPYTLVLTGFAADATPVDALTRTDTNVYDAEDRLVGVTSYPTPASSNVWIGESYIYDAAGRLRRRVYGAGPDTMVYDRAGNVIRAHYRSGQWITQTYDALNRIRTKATPEQVYSRSRCQGFMSGPISDGAGGSGCFMVFPYYPNSGDNLHIPADVATFVYDTVGNMIEATNSKAKILRTYYRGGALRTDTTLIKSYEVSEPGGPDPYEEELSFFGAPEPAAFVSDPWAGARVRGQRYTYDLSGRRTAMLWSAGTTVYQYEDFGALKSVADPWANLYRMYYRPDGMLDSMRLGTGVKETRQYDPDGRMTQRLRTGSGGSTIAFETMGYDRMNRMTSALTQSPTLGGEQHRVVYDGLGAVIANERTKDGATHVEEFRNDAMGNAIWRRTRSSAGGNDAPFHADYSPSGEKLVEWSVPTVQWGNQRLNELRQGYAPGGQLSRQDERVKHPQSDSVESHSLSRHYYGADDKLLVVQKYSVRGGSPVSTGTWEEYWYDALGRRVLTRTRRDQAAIHSPALSTTLCSSSTECRSYIERVWWDGDDALVEERTPEGATDVSNSGVVSNIHALGMDQPLAVNRGQTHVIAYNWRGLGISASTPSGDPMNLNLDWPAKVQPGVYFTPHIISISQGGSGPKLWLGTFVVNGQGSTGMLYRRNRYFDPASGRFTQQDPIGLAGGMNLYGFAEGDPITYSDPFGLSPCCVELRGVIQGVSDAQFEAALAGAWARSQDAVLGSVSLGARAAGAISRLSRPGSMGGRLLGKPNPVKANRAGNAQPYDAKTGEYLPNSANPGPGINPWSEFSLGVGQGFLESAGGGAVDLPAPISKAQELGQAVGKMAAAIREIIKN